MLIHTCAHIHKLIFQGHTSDHLGQLHLRKEVRNVELESREKGINKSINTCQEGALCKSW